MFTWERQAFDWTQRVITNFRKALDLECDSRTDDELRSILTLLVKEQGLDLLIKDMQHQIDDQFSLIRRQRDHLEKMESQYRHLLTVMAISIESEPKKAVAQQAKSKGPDLSSEKPSNVIEFKKQ